MSRLNGTKPARVFGLVLTVVFVSLGVRPIISGEAPHTSAVAIGLLIGLLAAVAPGVLAPLATRWLKLGVVMHSMTSEIVMRVLFFAILTPFAFVSRRRGNQVTAALRFDRLQKTYWIERDRAADSRMDRQFLDDEMKTLYELLVYLRVRKKFWLLPLLILMLLCGWLIVIGSGTLGPFVYTLF